jgi:hypothetical protein
VTGTPSGILKGEQVVRQLVVPIIVALLGAASGSPIATAAPNLEQMSDQDIQKLTPDQIEQIPFIDFFARVIKKPSGRQASVYVIEGLLYDLRYYPHLPVGDVTPDLTRAISAFQEKIKAPVTGVLLTGEFQKLSRQAKFVQSQDILPLGPSDRAEVIAVQDDYVSAQGTWTLKGGVAYPIHTVEITCDKREKTCREVTAEIHPPAEGLLNSGTYLALLTSSYPIVKWEGDIVVAERGGACRTLTLTIDANRNEVYQIARNGTDDKSCPLPALDEPRVATLTGSFKAGLSHNQQQQREKELLYAPAYQVVLRTLDTILSPDGTAKPR